MPPLSGDTTKTAPLGIGPVAHKNHHTSRMHKFIGITTSGFLPTDNDIKKGGRALRVRLDRTERIKVQRNTFVNNLYLRR